MGQLTITRVEGNPKDQIDSLRIKRNKSKGHINGFMTVFKFQDKDTNQFISYCPSFDLSGYGETEDKAVEMLKFSVSENRFFKNRKMNHVQNFTATKKIQTSYI